MRGKTGMWLPQHEHNLRFYLARKSRQSIENSPKRGEDRLRRSGRLRLGSGGAQAVHELVGARSRAPAAAVPLEQPRYFVDGHARYKLRDGLQVARATPFEVDMRYALAVKLYVDSTGTNAARSVRVHRYPSSQKRISSCKYLMRAREPSVEKEKFRRAIPSGQSAVNLDRRFANVGLRTRNAPLTRLF